MVVTEKKAKCENICRIFINQNPTRFIGIDKLILKFMWKLKGLRLSKQSREKKIGEITLLDFKTSKATVIKTIFDGTDIRTNK